MLGAAVVVAVAVGGVVGVAGLERAAGVLVVRGGVVGGGNELVRLQRDCWKPRNFPENLW